MNADKDAFYEKAAKGLAANHRLHQISEIQRFPLKDFFYLHRQRIALSTKGRIVSRKGVLQN